MSVFTLAKDATISCPVCPARFENPLAAQLAAANERVERAERERDEARRLCTLANDQLQHLDGIHRATKRDLAALRAAVAVTPENIEAVAEMLAQGDGLMRPQQRQRNHARTALTAIARRAPETAQKGSEPVLRGHCNRCDRCGWEFGDEPAKCRPKDCSMRPLPALRSHCAGCGAPYAMTGAEFLEAAQTIITPRTDEEIKEELADLRGDDDEPETPPTSPGDGGSCG